MQHGIGRTMNGPSDRKNQTETAMEFSQIFGLPQLSLFSQLTIPNHIPKQRYFKIISEWKIKYKVLIKCKILLCGG